MNPPSLTWHKHKSYNRSSRTPLLGPLQGSWWAALSLQLAGLQVCHWALAGEHWPCKEIEHVLKILAFTFVTIRHISDPISNSFLLISWEFFSCFFFNPNAKKYYGIYLYPLPFLLPSTISSGLFPSTLHYGDLYQIRERVCILFFFFKREIWTLEWFMELNNLIWH